MLKDERLARLSERLNVARFASFSPGQASGRFARLTGAREEAIPRVDTAIRALLEAAGSVNVRTFLDDDSKSTAFIYGLKRADDVQAAVIKFAADGFFTIVNETIDIHDGGVSGVSVGGVTEFAPDSTPRVVELADDSIARLPTPIAEKILSTVYGFDAHITPASDERLEFSLHPLKVGSRHEHTLYWEVANVRPQSLQVAAWWPNAFSRFLGDKAYGLLVADAFGLPVPKTTAIGRRYAPFVFGKPTGSSESWLRTSPANATPGHFTTVKGWRDPFALLETEDPERQVAAVLAQESVDAAYSGAAMTQANSGPLIEGVIGHGDTFMLGGLLEPVPRHVRQTVSALIRRAETVFGSVDIEWAYDGVTTWLLQVHPRPTTRLGHGVLSPGRSGTWLEFDPKDGLDVLRSLVNRAIVMGAGIQVTQPVGVTSHVGDILRAASVPGRIRI